LLATSGTFSSGFGKVYRQTPVGSGLILAWLPGAAAPLAGRKAGAHDCSLFD